MSGRLMDHVINRVKRLKLTTVMLAVLFLATAAHAADLDASKPLTRIAFGSCNKPELDQSMWSEVLDYKPQLWVWLGDIVYADHRLGRARFRMNNLSVIADRYATQKQLPLYSQVRESAHVIGIWDDHDYGINDGNRHMPLKEQVRDILLDFLDVPGDAAVRSRQGAYQSYSFGPSGQRVKIILCDGRYFKDKPASRAGWSRGEGTTLLGEEQWEWLQAELTDSDAQLHVIGSGTQIIPTDKSFAEKWENFPVERLRLLHAVRNSSIPTVLLSGDVHLSELLASHLNGTPLYELTASGMTHSWATHFGLGNTLGRYARLSNNLARSAPSHTLFPTGCLPLICCRAPSDSSLCCHPVILDR
eukprot:PLAT10724.1.p1 GENE.PLAT10724.1~~PLAT10724.1.p1  ORF type:complete len:360 (-),score=36.60 PLAT10724.1:316-1395(-)